jgi:hypothetical protein
MEMPRVQTQRETVFDGATHIELMVADGIVLRTDTEQLRLRRIDDVQFLAAALDIVRTRSGGLGEVREFFEINEYLQ